MKTKELVMNGLFIAIHVVLCYVSLNLGNMVITFAGLPIIIGGMLFGPLSGTSIGLIGSFINQVMKYGLTITTVLWILPAGVRGLMIGVYAKKKNYKLTPFQMITILVVSGLVVTGLNTFVMYADSKIFGYYTWGYVFGMLIPRVLSSMITSFIYLFVVPTIVKSLRMILSNTYQTN